jgi:hypothetical protein
MHHFRNGFTLSIMDTVNGTLESIIDDITFYLENIQPWAASLVLLAVGILALVGFFVMLKKFIKTFIILGVLGGAGYLIYTQTDLLDSVLGGVLKIFL